MRRPPFGSEVPPSRETPVALNRLGVLPLLFLLFFLKNSERALLVIDLEEQRDQVDVEKDISSTQTFLHLISQGLSRFCLWSHKHLGHPGCHQRESDQHFLLPEVTATFRTS